MNILYYTRDEINKSDMIYQLEKIGHGIVKIEYDIKDYLNDTYIFNVIEAVLKERHFDCIMSVNFFPIISKIALRNKIPYISWTFDSPCMTWYSEMIYSPYNYLFHFDNSEVEKFRAKGVKHVWYLPLAVNVERLDALFERINSEGDSCRGIDKKLVNKGVSFMGNLYNDQYNFFDQIAGLPEYVKGFVNGAIDAQLQVMGCDILKESITNDIMDEILKFVSFNQDEEMFISDYEVLMNMIKRKATAVERSRLLKEISTEYDVTLYSQSDSSGLPDIDNRGCVGYMNEMPVMFRNSAINLNITLRTIESGISLRCMDICGAGGFLLTNYQPELARLFTDGEEIVMYYDRADLMSKIGYYLEHEQERKQIALNGNKKIRENYTYRIQLEKMFEIVSEAGGFN